jgi:hypothetical protein
MALDLKHVSALASEHDAEIKEAVDLASEA